MTGASKRICLLALVIAGSTPLIAAAASAIEPEAVAVLEREGLHFSPPAPEDLTTLPAFKRYLGRLDAFADYLTRDESLQFERAQRDSYIGVGLELERRESGEIIAHPIPGSPAARAGIAAGDRVLGIEGNSTLGLALPSLVAMAAGPAGSQLILDVSRGDHGLRRVTMTRKKALETVAQTRVSSYSMLRIPAFTAETRQQLEFLVAHPNGSEPVIIDLRGNRGGDLHAAIDCAMLFLHRGATVATVRTRRGVRSYVSSIDGRSPSSVPVYLWQDESTASAAEAFIAALRDNRRGVSIGRKTFGKGSEQRMIRLKSGAMLLLTTGDLITPGGREIEGLGLVPDVVLPAGSETSSYLDEVARLARTPLPTSVPLAG